MSLFNAMGISATGMSAERTRMDVASENLANANSTGGANGAYRRKEVALRTVGGAGTSAGFASALSAAANAGSAMGTRSSIGTTNGGVEVAAIQDDKTPNRHVYDPGHPDADAKGYVEMPNVNPVVEMTDLISSSRAYEANVTAMNTTKAMISRTMDLLR
jgi:flagellar basal-body rod protein FlgC